MGLLNNNDIVHLHFSYIKTQTMKTIFGSFNTVTNMLVLSRLLSIVVFSLKANNYKNRDCCYFP